MDRCYFDKMHFIRVVAAEDPVSSKSLFLCRKDRVKASTPAPTPLWISDVILGLPLSLITFLSIAKSTRGVANNKGAVLNFIK